MDHKAFAFDWNAFNAQLRPELEDALRTDNTDALARWIDQNRGGLTDPYEGEPLPKDWRSLMENGDVQELGDFALTRYYQPTEDCGLADEWTELSDELPEDAAAVLLGSTLGPEENLFDPGRMGAYFQTPEEVKRSIAALEALDLEALEPMLELLRKCRTRGLGVYVTF